MKQALGKRVIIDYVFSYIVDGRSIIDTHAGPIIMRKSSPV